jgi:glycosyltransferase involved in cell wall biosynthesis
VRIAQVAPVWLPVPPRGYGGIEWVVFLLTEGLVARGHEVTLFASGGSRTRARLVSVFEEAPTTARIHESYWELAHALAAYNRHGEFDLIHDHSGSIGPAVGGFTGTPVVHTLHGPATPRARHLYGLMRERVWFVAISRYQMEQMPELRYAGVVYNGIPLELYPFRQEKEDFLLFLGRASREKGPEVAVRVARRLGARLVLAVKVVEEPEKRYWREVVEPELSGEETVLGEVSPAEKADLLARARAVLFPIQWPEPFGLVMAEAMACGTPVVAFRNGSSPEVIEDGVTGFLVPEGDEDGMAAAVKRVGEIDPAACRRRVEERFSQDVMVEGYLRAYLKVLAEARGSSAGGQT